MMAAVAAQLSIKLSCSVDTAETRIISISFNSTTPYEQEDAREALCRRIAVALSGMNSDVFDAMHPNPEEYVVSIVEWIVTQKLILLIDELNMIPPDAPSYGKMSNLLDNLIGRKGCALLYSTHLRDTVDLLRGRGRRQTAARFSFREHTWLSIPRIENQGCINGLVRGESISENSMWCSVLRGRIPCLFLTPPHEIESFAKTAFLTAEEVGYLGGITEAEYNRRQHAERIEALKAVITGKIGSLPRERNMFAAFSYASTTQVEEGVSRFAWPPFMIAQKRVLGKNYERLRATLENPHIEEAKAFEALVQLSVLVRLLVNESHDLVPRNDAIAEGDDFDATELFYPDNSATDTGSLKRAVHARFCQDEFEAVQQVVAVPSFAQFPLYDFFVLHRNSSNNMWDIVAGYQCKQTKQSIDQNHAAGVDVPLSVWVEGNCSEFRQDAKKQKVQQDSKHGWTVLGRKMQQDLLGVSVWEALPFNVPDDYEAQYDNRCSAEVRYRTSLQAALDAEQSTIPSAMSS